MNDETNKKSNVLVIVLGIVILILCGVIFYLAFNLGKEVANKEDNAIVDNNNNNNNTDSDNNKTEDDKNSTGNSTTTGELSLEDADVKKIIDKFGLDPKNHSYLWQFNIYKNEIVRDVDLVYLIDMSKIENKDENCNSSKYSNLDKGYEYKCKYINYDALNNEYKKLSGKNLRKEALTVDLTYLIYDSESNVYRICDIMAGGGFGMNFISKINKAVKSDDYIYIYEDIVYASEYYEGSIKLYSENTKEADIVNIYENQSNFSPEFETMVRNKYSSVFDTYKWTFKKDSNGEYVYESLEYIEK